jgi:alpha-L-fucosidase
MNKHTTSPLYWMALVSLTIQLSPLGAAAPPSGEQSKDNYGENPPTIVQEDAKQYLFAPPKDLEWFQDAKFGIFICWGPCSLKEAEIGWGRHGRRPGTGNDAPRGVPEEEYDNLYKQFNPVKFDADGWVKMIRDSGAKYMIFLTKHHDGFCMFDADNTDYKITNTPYGKDVAKLLADACHKYGIKIFWYYSQPDWYHPDYLTRHHERYREYVFQQIRQLLTNYGKIDGVWFDCLGSSWKHWNTPELVKMIRHLQPGILINNRWGWGMPGVEHNGDFETPEQKIGMFKIDRPWETCATMGQGWSWRGGGSLMSAEDCVRLLVRCVGAGGNLALDCGPMPDGRIFPPAKENYLAMGKWLKTHGDSIYGTRGGPYKPGLYGVSTRKGNNIYLHILAEHSADSIPKISFPLPFGEAKVLGVTELTSGKSMPFIVKNEIITLDMADLPKDNPDTVIVMKLDAPTEDIPVIDMSPDKRRVALKGASASSSYDKLKSPDAVLSNKKWTFEAGIHRHSMWVAKPNAGPYWFQVDFETPEKVSAISIAEPRGRLNSTKFNLQYETNGDWKTLFSGKSIGKGKYILFNPVETSKIRLNFIECKPGGTPALEKFNLYKAEED